MRHTLFSVGAIFVLTLGSWSCQSPTRLSADVNQALACIQPDALRAHIRFLSDDLLEGREAGTRGFTLAAKYVASAFEAMGLQPAGVGETYFQQVPFRTSRVVRERSSLTLHRNGWSKKLRLGKDYILATNYYREETRVKAPLIFVGFGITAPELGYDDYAGLNAEGKIAVMFHGAPAAFPNNQRAYYSGRPKMQNALAHGAVGVLDMLLPADAERVPWSAIAARAKSPGMRWLDADGHPSGAWAEIRGAGLLNQKGAEAIFAHAPASLEDVVSDVEAGTLRGFDIPLEVEMATVSRFGRAESPNVIAKLEGSDPELRNEYLVYTAHLDHDGMVETLEGDNIFNGAYDNASGVAVMLEIARAFGCLPEPPRRSILFVGTTAEEKGLLGADYFAQHATVSQDSMVANLNLDTPLMLYPIRDIVVFGGEHSSLGDTFQQAASSLGLSISPDPMPEEVLFVRSDQFPFVRQGIPAAFAMIGLQSADAEIDGEAATRTWMATVYHTPTDDFSQKLDLQTGTSYARVNFLAGYNVAQSSERPTWKEGDFFGERFTGHREGTNWK